MTEALLNNPKVEVLDDGYKFRPIYNVRDKKGLLAVLKDHDVHGLGTITMEAIEESVPNVAKVMKVRLQFHYCDESRAQTYGCLEQSSL